MICENCNIEHNGEYGSGRFCNAKCARSFSSKDKRSAINERVSQKLKGRPYLRNGVAPNQKPRIVVENKCVNCSQPMSHIVPDTEAGRKHIKKTCSKQCFLAFSSKSGRESAAIQGDTRRSKNEKLFAEMCIDHFNSVATNAKLFNGWDADVVIHDHKIAVLWNGRWHYEQIANGHSVKQVQNRDTIKLKEIEAAGYVPYVIKDMGRFNETFVADQFRELVNWLSQIPHKD